MQEKGHCKHGEFILSEGCPQCIEERQIAGIKPENDEMEDGLNAEGFTLGNVGEPITITESLLEESVTALATSPGADAIVIGYYNQGLSLQHYAEERAIATPEDAKAATDDLSVMSKLKRDMETKRKEYLEPLKTQSDAIRATYEYLMAPVLEADQITRGKMLTYHQEQERVRLEQEAINQKRLEAAEAEMRLKGELSESVGLIEVVPEAPKRVSTDMGTTGMTDHWKYEVVDFAQLPDEYKVADTAMLNSIAKKHHNQKQIPGVRFYNEPIINVRAR